MDRHLADGIESFLSGEDPKTVVLGIWGHKNIDSIDLSLAVNSLADSHFMFLQQQGWEVLEATGTSDGPLSISIRGPFSPTAINLLDKQPWTTLTRPKTNFSLKLAQTMALAEESEDPASIISTQVGSSDGDTVHVQITVTPSVEARMDDLRALGWEITRIHHNRPDAKIATIKGSFYDLTNLAHVGWVQIVFKLPGKAYPL